MEKVMLKSNAAVGLSDFSMVCYWRCTCCASQRPRWLATTREKYIMYAFRCLFVPAYRFTHSLLNHHHQARVMYRGCPVLSSTFEISYAFSQEDDFISKSTFTNFLPTILIRSLWYPSTVCTPWKGIWPIFLFLFFVILSYPLINFFTKWIQPVLDLIYQVFILHNQNNRWLFLGGFDFGCFRKLYLWVRSQRPSLRWHSHLE